MFLGFYFLRMREVGVGGGTDRGGLGRDSREVVVLCWSAGLAPSLESDFRMDCLQWLVFV